MFTVLYTDDESGLLELGKVFLESSGPFTVETALSARDALKTLKKGPVDCIVSDYMMPGMNGIAFLKALRNEGSRIPFILFTGRGREEVVIEALNNGADFYLQKGGEPAAQFAELSHKIRLAVEHSRTTKALEDSEERLRSFMDSATDAFTIWDANLNLVDLNKVALSYLPPGTRKEDVTGRNYAEFMPGSKERGEYERYLEVVKSGVPFLSNEMMPDPQYGRRWLNVKCFRVGTGLGIVTTDVTRQKEADDELRAAYERLTVTEEELRSQYDELAKGQEQLRASEEKYRRITDNARDMIYRMSLPDGRYEYVSPASVAMTGYSAEEFYKDPGLVQRLIHPAWQDFFRQQFEAMLQKNVPPYYEYQIVDRAGKTRWFNQRNVLITGGRGEPAAIEGIVTDITERRQAEEALRMANKKLNLLASMTRHDILNKIAVALGFLKITGQKYPDPGLHDYLEKAGAAVTAIRSQIEFTRVYQNLGTQEPQWIDPDSVIPRAQVPEGVRLDTDLQGISVYADLMLEKVFYNLLDNSVRHGEHVTGIRVFSRNSGGDLTIMWEDDGAGIAADEKERIFERGFGKNNGFGLFLSREILAITGITIRESGEPGKGARFEITVPAGAWRRPGPGPAVQ